MESIDMRKLIAGFILYLLFGHYLVAGSLPTLQSRIMEGKKLIYQFDLPRAELYFDSLTRLYPSHPIPFFYRGYIKLILYSQDMVNENLMNGLVREFELCVEKTEKIPGYEKDPRLLYYLGLSYGAIGIRYALDQSYIKAYWFGRKGKNYLERAAALDSTFYDVYLGLGIYHYYIGLMPGIVKFFARLLGFSGNKEKGLREISLCARKGHEFKMEARLAYNVLRYFMQNELSRIHNIEALGKLFPRNPVIPMMVGYHYRRTGFPEKALVYFKQVSDSVNNYLPQIYQMKYYNIAVCKYLLNDFESMYHILNTFLVPEKSKMTEYYQSALNYYMGQYYLLNNNTQTGIELLKRIPDKHHTSFWFLSAEPFIHYPVCGVFRQIIEYKNNIFSHRWQNDGLINEIEAYYRSHPRDFWYYYYLDSRGIAFYLSGKYREALKIFSNLNHRLQKFERAGYFRKWVLLHFGRTLTKLGKYDQAEELVKLAREIDDNYIKFIAERELYIIESEKKKDKQEIYR